MIYEKAGMRLIPAVMYTITGKDARAFDPAMIKKVNKTKLGSRLTNPDQSIGVILGTPTPQIDNILNVKQPTRVCQPWKTIGN